MRFKYAKKPLFSKKSGFFAKRAFLGSFFQKDRYIFLFTCGVYMTSAGTSLA